MNRQDGPVTNSDRHVLKVVAVILAACAGAVGLGIAVGHSVADEVRPARMVDARP